LFNFAFHILQKNIRTVTLIQWAGICAEGGFNPCALAVLSPVMVELVFRQRLGVYHCAIHRLERGQVFVLYKGKGFNPLVTEKDGQKGSFVSSNDIIASKDLYDTDTVLDHIYT